MPAAANPASRARIALLGGLAAVLLTGCSRPVNPPAKYRHQTSAICMDATRQVRALPIPRTNAELITVARRVRAINRHMTDRIAALDTPSGARGEHRQDSVVDAGIRIDIAARLLIKTLKQSPQPRRELERRRPALRRAAASATRVLAQARLRACAEGPPRALAELGARRA